LKPGSLISRRRRGLSVLDEGFRELRERRPAVACRQLEQTEKHLRRDEGIPARGVTIVRNHTKQVAERVERERAYGWPPGECSVALEMQGQIHRVEASVQRPKPPPALVARIERADVVPVVSESRTTNRTCSIGVSSLQVTSKHAR
jgi:hypothetical protein